jgi:hypothetical protein
MWVVLGITTGSLAGIAVGARRDGIAPRAAIKDETETVPLRAAATTADPDAATMTTIPNNNNPNPERIGHHQETNQHQQQQQHPQGVRK